jgi:hypothetical protein
VDNIARVLKVFVIVGGVVLVGGAVLLVVLILTRDARRQPADLPEPARAESAGAPGPGAASPTADDASAVSGPAGRLCQAGPPQAEPMSVPLPAGARVEQVVPNGACLILLGVDGSGRQFVALVDPFTGRRISLLLLHPEE